LARHHMRMTAPRIALAAVAAAGAVALGAPAAGLGAAAAIQDDRLPIVPVTEIPSRLDAIEKTNARVTRVDVFWSEVAPTRPSRPNDHRDPVYEWDRTDAIFNGLRARGIVPIVSVYSSPEWAAGGRAGLDIGQVNANAPDARQFGLFMTALAARYRTRVRHYEIWNEPNLPRFLTPRRGSALSTYLGLVRAAYPAVHRANPRATVIAGSLGPNGNSRSWLNALVTGRNLRFDAVSQHIYPIAPPNRRTRSYPSWSSVPSIIAKLDSRERTRGMPLYITEAGYTTDRTIFRSFRVTPAKQRQYLKEIFALPAIRSPRVPAVVWFNLEDNRFWPGGLTYEGGRAKPSLAAFRAVARKPLTAAERRELRR
jgi:hypothetical protein